MAIGLLNETLNHRESEPSTLANAFGGEERFSRMRERLLTIDAIALMKAGYQEVSELLERFEKARSSKNLLSKYVMH